jgi:hypothetical protein
MICEWGCRICSSNTVYYKISLEGKSSDNLEVDVVAQGRSLRQLGCIEAQITEEDEI